MSLKCSFYKHKFVYQELGTEDVRIYYNKCILAHAH